LVPGRLGSRRGMARDGTAKWFNDGEDYHFIEVLRG
jgi:hypothetical protein